eukprot:1923024-Alexandrium_andersonii.AAC.1
MMWPAAVAAPAAKRVAVRRQGRQGPAWPASPTAPLVARWAAAARAARARTQQQRRRRRSDCEVVPRWVPRRFRSGLSH